MVTSGAARLEIEQSISKGYKMQAVNIRFVSRIRRTPST